MKNREVYKVLKELGMTEEEITKAFEVNKNLSFVIGSDVTQMIEFYKTYGLSDEEIIKIENANPYFLTESFVRIRFLEEDYERLGIKDLGQLLLKHPGAMSINPQELYDYINKNLEEGKSLDEIREDIMENYESLFKYM